MKILLSNLDIVLLIIVFVVLFFNFRKLVGKRTGFFKNKQDFLKNNTDISDTTTDIPNKTSAKEPEVKRKDVMDLEGKVIEPNLDELRTEGKLPEMDSELLSKYPQGSLMGSVQKILLLDKTFNYKNFLEQQKQVFTKVVTNFNFGKLDEVKEYLSNKVFIAFNNVIADINFIPKDVKIIAFSNIMYDDVDVSSDKIASIGIKFHTRQLINGTEQLISEVWTFTKDLNTSGNWLLTKIKI